MSQSFLAAKAVMTHSVESCIVNNGLEARKDSNANCASKLSIQVSQTDSRTRYKPTVEAKHERWMADYGKTNQKQRREGISTEDTWEEFQAG